MGLFEISYHKIIIRVKFKYINSYNIKGLLIPNNTMDKTVITPNTSDQSLGSSDNDYSTPFLQNKSSSRRDDLRSLTASECITVGILCFVNLINYMDRFTIAGKFNKHFSRLI